MSGFVRLLKQKLSPPKPETASFARRTVLITGATTGLGLEAAKKIACLEPQTLIITARSEERGQKAKQSILNHVQQTKPKTPAPEISVLLLDMSQFGPVITFANQVTTDFPSLDTVILNAGSASNSWTDSPEGWEQQLQVNSLSTTLLALLLLPKLTANAAKDVSYTPHLEIVTSGLARVVAPKSMQPFIDADNALSQLSNRASYPDPDSLSTARGQYARSKLVMELNMRHIAKLPSIVRESGTVDVVVNSSCPGLCNTDLGREMRTGILMILLMKVFYAIFGRSAEQGSNTLVSALTRDVDGQGKMWKDDKYYDGGAFIESVEGKEFGDKIWRETCEVLLAQDADLQTIL